MAKIAMVHVFGIIEDEQCFSSSGQSTLLFWWQYYQIDENASSCWMDR
jgi:hypothetical protein